MFVNALRCLPQWCVLKFIVLIISIFLVEVVYGQALPTSFSPCYIHFNELDGLPSNNIFGAFEDSEKYLWFASDNGVSRFDGIRFQNFSVNDGLTDNEVFSIWQDSYERIWFLTYSGIPCFYFKGAIFNPNNTGFLKLIKPGNFLSAAYEDHFGNVYLGSKSGFLYRIDRSNGVTEMAKFEGGAIYSIMESQDRKVQAIFSPHKLAIFGSHTVTTISFGDSVYFYPPRVAALPKGRFLIGNGNRLELYSANKKERNFQFEEVSENGVIINIFVDKSGNYWVSTTNGAYRKSAEVPSWDKYLVGHHISGTIIDHEGGVWFTSNKGIYYSPNTSIRSNVNIESCEQKEITCLTKFNENIIYAGDQNGRVTSIDVQSGAEQFIFEVRNQDGHEARINQIVANGGNQLVILSQDGAYLLFRNNVLKLTKANIRRMLRHSIFQDCICYTFGWKSFEMDLLNSWEMELPSMQVPALRARCFDLAYTPSGKVWAATAGGIFEIDNKDSEVPKQILSPIEGLRITCLRFDSTGALWIGTAGRGLVRIDQMGDFAMMSDPYSPNTTINSIVFSGSGSVYAGTNNGVLRVLRSQAKGDWQLDWVGKEDGLAQARVSDLLRIGNTIWAATSSGVVVFHDSLFDRHAFAPSPRINRLSVDASDRRVESEVILPYHQNAIGIGFIGTSFNSLGDVRYRYRMVGLDTNWTYTSRDFVEYPNVEPGTYRFEVQANTRKGGWSRSSAELGIIVSAPFWRTGWFLFIFPFSVLSVVIILLVARISGIQKKNEAERRALEAEQRLLSVQMNPHFIFNALNSMQGHFFVGDLARYNEYLTDLSRVIRTILEHSRSTLIGLDEEIRFVTEYTKLQAARLNGRFSYQVSIMKGMNPSQFKIPPMLLQPFIENAVLHGLSPKNSEGRLTISFYLESGLIVCVIEDDGVGRKQASMVPSQQEVTNKKSLALEITQERIEILNKTKKARIQLVIEDLVDKMGGATGTRITLRMASDIQW